MQLWCSKKNTITAFICSMLFVSCLTSCDKRTISEEVNDGLLKVKAFAYCESTRTSINGTSLSWKSGDVLGVYISGIANNLSFLYSDNGYFTGFISDKAKLPMKRAVYAYYPYSTQDWNQPYNTVLSGSLPKGQNAPFDPRADYMVSDRTFMVSGGESDPHIDLTFSNHLFSILEINVTNTNPSLTGETLCGVSIESKTKILSGAFCFDASLGQDAEASFSNDPLAVYHTIDAMYPNEVTLGKDVKHTINVVVPAGEYPAGDISVSVYVGDKKAVLTANSDMVFETGNVHELQSIDVGTQELIKCHRTMVIFGDSITTRTVADCLQELLGVEWTVYLAGVSGESVLQIMSRTGATPLYIKGSFTIPGSSEESVDIGTSFLSDLQTNGDRLPEPEIALNVDLGSYSPGRKNTYCGLSNPFKVNGVECTVSKVGGRLQLKRLSDGEDVKCDGPYTEAIPYAKWKLGNPDVLSVYMGTNGTYTANATTGRTRDQVLADFYHMVQNSTAGEFIAVGYHHGSWNASYRDTFTEEFTKDGKCCYLDLRTDGCKYAETIAAQEGYVLTPLDKENISNNIWPATWGGLDIHPYTPVGGRAHAYCIYYKMKELDYLDE